MCNLSLSSLLDLVHSLPNHLPASEGAAAAELDRTKQAHATTTMLKPAMVTMGCRAVQSSAESVLPCSGLIYSMICAAGVPGGDERGQSIVLYSLTTPETVKVTRCPLLHHRV